MLAAPGAACQIQAQIRSINDAAGNKLRRKLSKIFQRLISVRGFGTDSGRVAAGTRGKIHEAICQSPRFHRCCRLL